MKPLLSICIPTYNRAHSLLCTLNSLKSSLNNIESGLVELCISDNASSDDTQQIINQWSCSGVSIRSIKHSRNLGFSKNYRSVINLSRGLFTWVTGDDDKFDEYCLNILISRLMKFKGDVLFINCNPSNKSVEALPDCEIRGLKEYFILLGVFHASFIGNSIFRTKSIISQCEINFPYDSAYPHMAAIFQLIISGKSVFWNLKCTIADDSLRTWKIRQPLLTAVDMATVVTDHAFQYKVCSISLRFRIYLFLGRSLPRAAALIAAKKIANDSNCIYQSISSANLRRAYRGIPIFGNIASLVANISYYCNKWFIKHRIFLTRNE